MNRDNYFNYIVEKLTTLLYRIQILGKFNLLNLNIHSENFFAELFNLIFQYKLINANSIQQNCAAIDLIDTTKKILVQVSSDASYRKITNTLTPLDSTTYDNYHLIFIGIKDDVSNLKNRTYNIPSNIIFYPKQDIWGVTDLLRNIINMDIESLRCVYEFIRKELGSEPDIVKVQSNLATIINILSKDRNPPNKSPEINEFEIQRKIEFNNLQDVQETIEEYMIYYKKLDEIYGEFDTLGENKRLSVLHTINQEYVKINSVSADAKTVFFEIKDAVIKIIQSSENYEDMPFEELDMCVTILIVDAFIRCKIFKNPEGYKYVTTR